MSHKGTVNVTVVNRPGSLSQQLYLPAIAEGLGVTFKHFVTNFAKNVTGFRKKSEIQTIDTTSVPPMSHAAAAGTLFRDDTVEPSLPRDAALANAPDADRDAGLFRVPKVL